MNFKKLGETDLNVSRIGIGTWAMGGRWQWGWGRQQDSDSIETIHQALTQGVNWLDTAPVYGLGHSEEVVGKALSDIPASERPMVFTKCGFNWNGQGDVTPSLTARSIREEIEASLKRLCVETIDLYQIHWPNPESELEEAWATLSELKQEGKIRYAGVSNFSVEQMQRISPIMPIDSLQPNYSLIHRDVETHVLPYCDMHDMGVLAYSPMGSGLLTGKMTRTRIEALPEDDWRREAPAFNEPQLSVNLAIVQVLEGISSNYGVSCAAAAIAWTFAHPALSAAIVGMRTPDQVQALVTAGSLQLKDEDIEALNLASMEPAASEGE